MVDKIIPDDLRNVQSDKKTNDYFLIPLNDLNPGEMYNMQFAWVYPDKTNSEWSSTFSVKAAEEMLDLTPSFVSSDLTGGKGFISIRWRGRDIQDTVIEGIKQVNIWITGGQYGNSYVKIAESFNSASTKTVYVAPGRYYVKLQAVGYSGVLSNFSAIQNVFSLKAPLAATNIQTTWRASNGTTKTDTLKVSFNFDPNFEDSTSSGKDVDSFRISLTGNGIKRSWIVPINKASTTQNFELSPSMNQAAFQLFSETLTVGITTIITGLSESVLVEETSVPYETPLVTPIITLVKGILLYQVIWNSQSGSTFDQIYIEEVESSSSSAPLTGYTQVAQGTQNPLTVNTLNSNQRWVRTRFYDAYGNATSYSTPAKITPDASVTADTEGPPDVSSVTTSVGLDTSGAIGFNGYANVSWSSVTSGGIRGYRIRYKATSSSSYSYADSPGSGTSYMLTGLGAGLTYQIAVATYDEFNNTSSNYVSGSNVTVRGTFYIPDTLDVTGYFSAKANESDLNSTAFKFGYGVDTGKRGLVFNSNNYWYIDSNQSASLKVGGATTNFIQWNGESFIIDGDLRAKKGTFSGNINMALGASIYSGTIAGNTVSVTGDTGGEISGDGYILRKTGLAFYKDSTETTVISASTGRLTTKLATIGGWNVDSTTINKNGITFTAPILDTSKPSIIINKAAYYLGMQTPDPTSPLITDIVLWAGESSTGGTYLSGPSFRVTAGGTLYASGAVIQGDVTFAAGSTTATYLNGIDTKATEAKAGATVAQAALTSKLEKTGGLIESNDQNQIVRFLSNGLNIYSGTFKILKPGEADVISGPRLIINSAGILGNNGSKNTFVIGTDGNATFSGSIEASTITGSIFTSSNYNVSGRSGMGLAETTLGDAQVLSFKYGSTTTGYLYSQHMSDGSDRLILRTPSAGGIEFQSDGDVFLTSTKSALIQSPAISLTSSTSTINLFSTTSTNISSKTSTSIFSEGSIALTTGGDSASSISFNAKTTLYAAINGATKLSITSTTASLYGGTNELLLSSDVATLTKSHAASGKGLRNILFTQNASTPSTGDPGDIVLVYV